MEAVTSSTGAPFSIETKPRSVRRTWINVEERLPDDGELVQVILARSQEIRVACRGHYQRTAAWFDSETRTPIYETVTHWRARD